MFRFGATALAALVHDVIVVVGTFALLGTFFGVEIDGLFVTAMLTIIGFSVHDTIVVYDRIREKRARTPASRSMTLSTIRSSRTLGRSDQHERRRHLHAEPRFLLFRRHRNHRSHPRLLIVDHVGHLSSIFQPAAPLLTLWEEYDQRRKAQAARPARRATT